MHPDRLNKKGFIGSSLTIALFDDRPCSMKAQKASQSGWWKGGVSETNASQNSSFVGRTAPTE